MKILKIAIKIGNVLLVVGALGVFGYYFAWKKIETNLLQKGFNMAISQIINAVNQTGEVQLDTDLILIKKTQ